MKRFAPSKRTLGILLFAAGILLGTLLTAALTWAGLEADFYGFQFLPADRFDGLTCPTLMSTHETGAILVQVNNPSKESVNPIIRLDVSTRGVPDTKQVQLKIEPGETRQFEQPITAKNIDLDFFIFAKAYRSASYPLPEANATCGILALDVPFLNGQQLFNIWLALSLILIPLGLWMWSSSLQPEGAGRTSNAAKVLAVIALGGLLVSLKGMWVLGVLLLALTLLMFSALLRFAVQE
jgi:hypothetical protein